MSANIWYGVRCGTNTLIGVYNTWPDTKAAVEEHHGHCKKFKTREEAETWARGDLVTTPKAPAVAKASVLNVREGTAPPNAKPGDFVIYTDGSCLDNGSVHNRRPRAGAAALFLRVGENNVMTRTPEHDISEPLSPTETHTNQRAELRAAILGLEKAADLVALNPQACVWLFTDSKWLLTYLGYVPGWRAAGWKGTKNQPIEHADMWQRLHLLVMASPYAVLMKVKAHFEDVFNEQVDALCKAAAASLTIEPL